MKTRIERTFGPRLVAIAAGFAVAALYLATLSGNHSETEDSLSFAWRVRRGPDSTFFEASHLVFDWVAWLVFAGVRGLGISSDPVRTLQVFDAIVAATAVGLLIAVLERAGFGRSGALLAGALVAFSYGFWRNGVEVEVYALSALALVACLGAALRAAERPSARAFRVLGVVSGLAILAHVANVFFAAVVLAVLVLLRPRAAEAARYVGEYVVSGVVVVVAAYGAAIVSLHLTSVHDFWDWMTFESSGGGYGAITPRRLAEAVVGFGRALVGGHFALVIPSIKQRAGSHFLEERYFLRGFSESFALTLLVVSAVTVVLACVQTGAASRAFSELRGRRRTVGVLCGVWLASFLPLLAIWDPANIELWYAAWMPLAVLLAIPLTSVRARGPWLGVGVVLAAGVFAVNLFGSQLPQRTDAKDYWRVRASWYVAHMNRDDLVVSYGYIWSNYLRYLTRADVIDAQQVAKQHSTAATVRIANAAIRRSNADRVYVSGYVQKPPTQDCLADRATCTISAALWRSLRPHVRLAGHSHFESVWRYSPQ